jgi:hypothetical protein
MLAANTPGTQVKPLLLTVYNEGNRMNIWHPAPFGMALGMTDIVTELGRFTTPIALQPCLSLTIS